MNTTTSLRARAQHQDQQEQVERVLMAMRDGCVLQLTQRPVLKLWSLSNGMKVRDETARIVIAHRNVVAVGDALFGGAFSETYRFVET